MDIRNVGNTGIGGFLAFLAIQQHKFKPRWASVGPAGPDNPPDNPPPPLLSEIGGRGAAAGPARAPGRSVPAPRASCRAEDSPGSATHTGTHSHVSTS